MQRKATKVAEFVALVFVCSARLFFIMWTAFAIYVCAQADDDGHKSLRIKANIQVFHM